MPVPSQCLISDMEQTGRVWSAPLLVALVPTVEAAAGLSQGVDGITYDCNVS